MGKTAKTRISQSELDVMDVLWPQSPLGDSEVAASLAESKDWNIRTIKTLLTRLVEKGALSTQVEGPPNKVSKTLNSFKRIYSLSLIHI